MWCDTCDFFER